jgi:hypothetical protein
MGVQELWSANSPGIRARSRPVDKEEHKRGIGLCLEEQVRIEICRSIPLFPTYISQSGVV